VLDQYGRYNENRDGVDPRLQARFVQSTVSVPPAPRVQAVILTLVPHRSMWPHFFVAHCSQIGYAQSVLLLTFSAPTKKLRKLWRMIEIAVCVGGIGITALGMLYIGCMAALSGGDIPGGP
jgi:hypothetical protein